MVKRLQIQPQTQLQPQSRLRPQPKSKPEPLSDMDAELIYSLSKCYDVMILYKRHGLELIIGKDATYIPSHEYTQKSFRPFIADYYIKYDSQNLGVDLRNGTLPKVSILRYNCDKSEEFVNLPGNATCQINVSNSGSKLLSLTPSQYSEYIKIHPKYLYKHKYVKHFTRQIDGRVEHYIGADLFQYCVDNCDCTGEAKYYFYIQDNVMNISYGKAKNNSKCCILTYDIVDQIKQTIDYARYTPTSTTGMISEADEIKQLILGIQLKVEFDY